MLQTAHSRSATLAATVLLTAVLLAGCKPATVVNAVSPSSHYVRSTDLAYGDGERQRLDVYQPVAGPPGDAPLVVFFYGGGWRGGDRGDFEFVASALTREGMVVVIPDYRLYPEVTFPAFVEDGAKSVAWAVENAARYGADPARLFLVGHSAGAHIAALLALDPRYLGAVRDAPTPVEGFIGLSGPYDFLPLDPGYLQGVFPEGERERSQPINFVSPDDPRTLLIHGTDDSRVVPENSRHLATALRNAGVPVTMHLYEGKGHVAVVASLAPPLDFVARTLPDCVDFIRGEDRHDRGR